MPPLKIIGAGWGRTGTLSLCHALELLGFSCHHMQSALLDLSQDPDLFIEAYHTRTGDWERAFMGYDAAVDWPAAEFWEELAVKYPDAKTIQDWPMSTELEWPEHMHKFRRMARAIIRDGALQGFSDKKAMIARYMKHIERVKKTIPSHRLLIFDAKDGWQPLCHFLNMSPPSGVSYPHSNRGGDFEARLLWIRKQILESGSEKSTSMFPADLKQMSASSLPMQSLCKDEAS
ncbi:sulfotransferase family protein [Aspergillus novofumigatus IBT 16806]|uniref:Sulfotransferase family protein n=1 Tax=Aspergillus novofumigatus (strain IBT 16806) TaxID=1392255 RepID=A0A2I1CCT0_ASPN1|nr:uncharacterized protein P174DRAFT_429796 [Aspergillus novofumigatus IBT 16806]PKX95424.1 hypothetical protein P174DRAFT_429796 [Aspergillus novofumigatus IBT 16806]